MASQTQLRQATISSQTYSRKSPIVIAEQSTQQLQTETGQSQKNVDLYVAAKMAFSGKGESNVSEQAKKYYQAILWGDTSKFTGEEKKILEGLSKGLKEQYTSKQQAGNVSLPTGSTFEVSFKSYGEQYKNITTPKRVDTTTVYIGGKEYKNVSKSEAQQALAGNKEVIANIKKMEGRVYTPNVKTITNLPLGNIDKFGRKEIRDTSGKLVGYESGGQSIKVEEGSFAQRVDEAKRRTSEYKNLVNLETKRYENLGYNKKEARILAQESAKVGGITFTAKGAKEQLSPKQKYVMGITGMSMAEAKKSEAGKIKEYGVTTIVEESSYKSGLIGGFFNKSKNELNIKPIEERGKKVPLFKGSNIMVTLPNFLADFGKDTSQNLTQSHEFAHKLDSMGKLDSTFSFKDASGGKVDEEYYKKSYGTDYEKRIEGEYKAKAYESYIENPEAFAKKFPKEAEVFNQAIGYTPTPKKNILTSIGDVFSLIKTTVTGVKEVGTQVGELKQELWKAGDAISQGELTELNKTIDYEKREAKKTFWNMIGITGNVVAGTTTPTTKTTIKETYITGLGAFVSPSPTGMQGTVYARQPTMEEQAKINLAQENILTINPQITERRVKDIDFSLKNIEDLNKKIEELEKGNVKDETWVGSEKDYKTYSELINKQSLEQQKLLSKGVTISSTGQVNYPTTKAGFFGFTRDIPITEVRTTYNAIKQPFMALTGKAVERTGIETPNPLFYAEKFGEELGQVIREPSRIKDYFAPKPKYVMDLNKGQFRETTSEDFKRMTWKERGDIKPQSIWTSEEIGKGVSAITGFGIDYGVSSIPFVGAGIYGVQVGTSIGESGGIIQWAKEKPIEAGTLAVIAGLRLYKVANKPILEYTRVANTPFVAVKETTRLREALNLKPTTQWTTMTTKEFSALTGNLKKNTIIRNLGTNYKEVNRNLALFGKERLAVQETVTKSELITGARSKPATYVEDTGFLKEYSLFPADVTDLGKGTITFSDIKSNLDDVSKIKFLDDIGEKGLKKKVEMGLITIKGYEIVPASGRLKLQGKPDVAGIQVVPRISKEVGGKVGIFGVSSQSKLTGGTVTNIKAFKGVGEDEYLVFESYSSKLGRKPKVFENALGKSEGTQILKVTPTETKGVVQVEYRQLPYKKDLYQFDIDELKRLTTSEKEALYKTGVPIKTELYKDTELITDIIPFERVNKDILDTPFFSATTTKIEKGIKVKTDIFGQTKTIPTTIDYSGEPTVSLGFKGGKGGSSGGTELLTKQELTSVLKKVTPVTTPVINIPKPSPTISLAESNYPTYVGGTKLFEGLGIGTVSASEVSSNYIEPTILQVPNNKFSLSLTGNVVQESRLKYDVGLLTIQKNELLTQHKELLLTKNIQKYNLDYLSLLKTQQVTKLKEEQLTKQTQQQVQLLKTEQLQKLKTKLLTTQITKQRLKQSKTKITPKITPKIIPSLSFGAGKKPIVKERLGREAFEVYIGKRGKERKIAETFELTRAGKELKKGLKLGLEAGGFVQEKKSGRKVKFEEIADILGAEFRSSKLTSERIIQRKEKVGLFGSRLGSRTERSLIQRARGKFL